MPNDISLTGLTEILYVARDQVVAEPTAFAQGVITNGGTDGISANGTVISMRSTEPTLETSYTPSMVVPDAADIVTSTESLNLNSFVGSSIPLKGEQFLQLSNTVGAETALQQLYAQAIRKMRNQIEIDIATAAYRGSSRAVGLAGTTPFITNFNAINDLRQVLEDNGCPMADGDISLAISTGAGTNLRNLTPLTRVNEAGSDATLRRGELLNIGGMSIRTSAGIRLHVKGTGSGYVVNQTGLVTNSTSVILGTGTGTILPGDIVTFASGAGSGFNYVVRTGLAAPGTMVLNQPGLRGAIANANSITVSNGYTANVGFHKSAIELAMRPPAQPPGGDAGQEIATLYDDKTGLSFSARLYKGYGVNEIKIMAFYGIKVWKPEFVATLMG